MKSPSVSVPVQLSLLCEKGRYVVFCLVPGHAGICGNKAADTAAKEAATDEVRPYDHTVVTDIQSYFHCAMYLA
jgi:ribonuclease HI